MRIDEIVGRDILNDVLEVLHSILVPTGIDKGLEILRKLQEKYSENRDAVELLIESQKKLEELKKLGGDCFADPYIYKIKEVRDLLISV